MACALLCMADPGQDTPMQQPRGMYFEDFKLGMTLVTSARNITSTDIVNFACLSGDFNEVHTNFEYCKSTPFGEPITHGPLIYAVAGGLTSRAASTTALCWPFWRSLTGGCSRP